MKIQTRRFGEIEHGPGDVIHFPEGIPGFEDRKGFLLLSVPEFQPLRWLQSVDDPWLAFVLADPAQFCPEYRIALPREDLRSIALEDVSKAFVLAILVVGREPDRATANLKGPLVFNLERNLAKQVILAGDEYPTRYPILFGSREPAASPA